MKKKIIFYQGKTQYSNTGDALINKSLIEHIRSHAHIFLNNKGMPNYYLKELGMKQSELTDKGEIGFIALMIKTAILNIFSQKQKIYFLATPPGHQFGGGITNFIKQFILVVLYGLLYSLGVKIIKIGFSIGPIDKSASVMERWKSRFIPFYYVRDPLSLDLVHHIGITKANFFPDLAWTYRVESESVFRNKVFLSFRNQVVTGMNGEAYATELIEKIKQLVVHGFCDYKVVIGYQVKEDRSFCELLYQAIKLEREVEFYDEQISLSSAETFSEFNFILTNRLHVALLAYQYGALPIILSDINKHMKIKGIFEYAGASALLLDVNDKDGALIDEVKYLIDSKDEILQKLTLKELEYESLSKRIIEEVFA